MSQGRQGPMPHQRRRREIWEGHERVGRASKAARGPQMQPDSREGFRGGCEGLRRGCEGLRSSWESLDGGGVGKRIANTIISSTATTTDSTVRNVPDLNAPDNMC